jgi:AraC-like DNA-binding protein
VGAISVSQPKHYLVDHCRLVTTDLDEARESVGRMWERHRSVMKRGRRYGLRWHQAELVDTTLSYGCTPSSIGIECGPVSDSFRITLHETGCLYHRIDGRDAVSTPTRAVVHVPGQELKMETEPFALLLLTFDGAYVRNCLHQRFERPPPLDAWPCEFPLTTPTGTALRALCRWTARELDRPGSEILGSDRAARSLERTLLMLFLDCMAEHHPIDRRKTEDLDAPRVRQIEEWIDSHFDEAIGIDDLARRAGVGVRSVQTAFRRVRGCTPMQMVLTRRLEATREMLCRATPGTRVTQVATECGFFNFGRFAAHYREKFGETPAQTLARARHRHG